VPTRLKHAMDQSAGMAGIKQPIGGAYVRIGSKLDRVGQGDTSINVRYASNTDRIGVSQRTDAKCASSRLMHRNKFAAEQPVGSCR
jgi:hypothetical protein